MLAKDHCIFKITQLMVATVLVQHVLEINTSEAFVSLKTSCYANYLHKQTTIMDKEYRITFPIKN